ncbi:hypothetical protein EGW08_002749 [Elysia chlorotica]|uniref:Rieske domain-containing protein n=1 Tax=Elysia chlorotica TaxID=188477 RepID=A0A3S1CD45_ELYCH|nr:hypothetical protein EGW08_002749 [Elysia chlorotica]
MTDSATDTDPQWHFLGNVAELKQQESRKVYLKSGAPLVLFYLDPDRFFVCSTVCPHAKGPLDQGDIEDLGDTVQVTCPLHFYSFDLTSGESSSGLKLKTYKTEIRGDKLFVACPEPISLKKS